MKKLWLIMLLLFQIPAFAQSNPPQNRSVTAGNAHAGGMPASGALPGWAAAHHYDATAHAYFPDYYTFYDPKRGGYVFWEDGKWTFSPAMPPYMRDADLSKTRLQILKGVSLDLYPELDYPYYMKLYPPDPNGNTAVPVPIPGNPATNQ